MTDGGGGDGGGGQQPSALHAATHATTSNKGYKGKVHLYSATIAAHATSAKLCITDRAIVQPRPQLKSALKLCAQAMRSRPWTLACRHTATQSPSMLVTPL